MMLMLEARSPCLLCGYQLACWAYPHARVNKHSIKVTGPSITAGPYWECPECGTASVEALHVRYRMRPESAAEVDAYRAKRWPT